MRHSANSLPTMIEVHLTKKKGVSNKQKQGGNFPLNLGFESCISISEGHHI